MKINDAVVEAVKQMYVDWEYQKDHPHTTCPACGSDDYDITPDTYRHCYHCGMDYSEARLCDLLRVRAMMVLTDKCLKLTGQTPRKLKSTKDD